MNVAASIDGKVVDALASKQLGGVLDGPALYETGRVERAVGPDDVEVAMRLLLGAIAALQNAAHFGRALYFRQASVNLRYFARWLVGAVAVIDVAEIVKDGINDTRFDCVYRRNLDRHAHNEVFSIKTLAQARACLSAEPSDWMNAWLVSVAPLTPSTWAV